jgi:putative DNA primase/helicase
MAVIHWPIKIAKEDRREFEEMVSSFEPEYAGILNWLIEGVHIFLKEGLVIPEAVEQAPRRNIATTWTARRASWPMYRQGRNAGPVQGRDLYAAYVDDTTTRAASR